ncbi:hypothetical protein P8452_59496 [Trifolium repens]|nr:hypothetical protein QL285_084746 [Trifolium repens]KAK2413962.1 hypothetical protein QL285_036612 [Trifolium repens]KAK2415349.1 hypothetical protein QL285_037835 [Trifolium repens]WJX76030.1 hypothetical protein P8452_59496 [Trifolium repens]
MESKKQKWFEASSPILYQKQKPNSIQFSFFHHRLLSPQLVPPPSFGDCSRSPFSAVYLTVASPSSVSTKGLHLDILNA